MSEKVLAGRYRLLEQIGFGGMALVYRAMDERTGHFVAVKILKPEYNQDAEFVSRFQREAEAASKMIHHNIVNLLDVGMDGDRRYLVMEYVQGKTLKEVIQEKGKLSAPVAGQITVRILSALQHAHSNGIIHRDIKPQNILVHADGHIKVADFGIARIANTPTLTKGDNVMGSVHYFSPEQARGEAANVTSDIYSVGVVLYEMLTGRVPYDGENPVAVAMQHIHGEPVPVQEISPDVPSAMVHVVQTAMAKDPAYRYQSAWDMASDLRAVLEERPDQMLNIPTPDPGATGQIPASGTGTDTAGTGSQKAQHGTAKKKKNTNNNARKLSWLGIVAGILVVAGLTGMILKWLKDSNNSAPVPGVTGLEVQEAVNVLENAGFSYQMYETANTTYPAGSVFLQIPKEGEIQKKGYEVVINVSTGPDSFEMENLKGYNYQDASARLKQVGITPILNKVVSADAPEGTVVGQQPEAGVRVSLEDSVQLDVSGGETWVPNLSGRTMTAALEMLEGYDLVMNPSITIQTTEDAQMHGKIAAQSPAADTPVVLGTAVALTVYSDPARERAVTLEVTIEPAETERSIKILVQPEQGGPEIQAISWILPPQEETVTSSQTFTVLDEGTYRYRVIVNNEEILQDLFTTN